MGPEQDSGNGTKRTLRMTIPRSFALGIRSATGRSIHVPVTVWCQGVGTCVLTAGSTDPSAVEPDVGEIRMQFPPSGGRSTRKVKFHLRKATASPVRATISVVGDGQLVQRAEFEVEVEVEAGEDPA